MQIRLREANRRAEMYKKRLQRLQAQGKNLQSPSPRTKVRNILRRRKIPCDLRKRLEFSEVLQKQLRENAKAAKGDAQKQLVAKAICGKVIAKYRAIKTIKRFCSWKRFNSSRKKTLFGKYERNKRSDVISDSLKNKVQQFFEFDSNSRMCPGRKDCITMGSVKKQKRLLSDTMRNLYDKFQKETEEKISYASFCKLRPFWVIQPRVQDRETCLCLKHENMQFLLDKLHFLGVISTANIVQFCRTLCCNAEDKACAYGECTSCRDEKKVQIVDASSTDSPSFYYKWITQNQTRHASTGKDIQVKVTTKVRVPGTVDEMVKAVNEALPDFLKHVYRIQHQYNYTKQLKENLKHNECLIHVDFSENYMCKFSSETQSVHFGASRQQASLHTGVIYTASAGHSGKQTMECTLCLKKKQDTKLLPITSPNVNRFSKFFHW